MKHKLFIFCSYLYFHCKATAFFKFNFLLKNISNTIYQALGVLSLFIIFKHLPQAENWNYYECLFLQGYANCVIATFHFFFSGFTNFASNYLYSREYDIVLMRPVPSLLQVMAANISIDRLPNIIVAVLIMVFASVNMQVQISVFTILFFIVFLILNVAVLGCINILLCSISFSIDMKVNLFVPLMNSFEFARYPFVLYSKIIVFVFTFVLPLATVAYLPVGFVLNKIAQSYTLLIPVVYLVVLVPVTLVVWRQQELKYGGM